VHARGWDTGHQGANILTTKDGSVKLADFGVATRMTEVRDKAVVGSPYWSACPAPCPAQHARAPPR
jgi:hypothetical protein